MLRLYTHLTESWTVRKENTQDNKKQLQKERFKVTVHTLIASVLDDTFMKSGKKKTGVFTGLQNFSGLTVLLSRKQVSKRAQRAGSRQTDTLRSTETQRCSVKGHFQDLHILIQLEGVHIIVLEQ